MLAALEKESRGFDPSEFVGTGNPAIPEQRLWAVTDCKLVNKFDEPVGKLVMTDCCLEFKVDRTQQCKLAHDLYDMTIDFLDIVSVSKLQIPNEEAIFNEDEFYTKNYTFTYMMQVEVSAINGLTVVTPKGDQPGWDPNETGAEIDPTDKAITSRSNISLANIFFKVCASVANLMIDATPGPHRRKTLPREQAAGAGRRPCN